MALKVAENLPENIAASQPVPPTELEKAQIAADEAATAAMTAAVTAKASAVDADAASVNAATMQTNESSGGHAYKARHYADIAQTAYMTAKTASEDAADATTVSAAVEARVAAQAAMVEAVAAGAEAVRHAGLAMDATDNELFIDGTIKTVGGTELNAAAGVTTNTDADGNIKKTGELYKLEVTGPAVRGVVFEEAMPDADPVVPGTEYKQAVAERPDLAIGKTVDSANDMARLLIVDSYVGTQSVKVYAAFEATASVNGIVKEGGKIEIGGIDYTLTSEGTYYRAGPSATRPDGLTNDLMVDPTLDPKEVFSYVTDPGDDAEAKVYVVLTPVTETTLEEEDGEEVIQVTRHYQLVDITVDGPVDADDAATQMQVRASIPKATPYKHIHFGVWAALGAAEKDGSQEIDGLGIGFVQNFRSRPRPAPTTCRIMVWPRTMATGLPPCRWRMTRATGPFPGGRSRFVERVLRDGQDHCYPDQFGHTYRKDCRGHVLGRHGVGHQ